MYLLTRDDRILGVIGYVRLLGLVNTRNPMIARTPAIGIPITAADRRQLLALSSAG